MVEAGLESAELKFEAQNREAEFSWFCDVAVNSGQNFSEVPLFDLFQSP